MLHNPKRIIHYTYCGRQNNATSLPKDPQVLVLATWEYIRSHGKEESTWQTGYGCSSGDLKEGDDPGLCREVAHVIPRSLHVEESGRREGGSQRDTMGGGLHPTLLALRTQEGSQGVRAASTNRKRPGNGFPSRASLEGTQPGTHRDFSLGNPILDF